MNVSTRRFLRVRTQSMAAATAIVISLSLVAGCGSGDGAQTANNDGEGTRTYLDGRPRPPAYAVESPTVYSQPDPSGAESATLFFSGLRRGAPTSAVVAGPNLADQKAAARQAVADGVPMFIAADTSAASLEPISRALSDASISAITTYGTDITLEGVDVTPAAGGPTSGASASEASESAESPAAPQPGFADLKEVADLEGRAAVPGSPTVLVAAGTTLAQVANARGVGARVEVLPAADPRATGESMAAVEDGNTIALGAGFDNQERFDREVELARFGELPGGGGLLFPGRRMVALYGHPSGPALGVLGEQPPAEAVARVEDLAAQYQQETDFPVMPAFEIIATVASGSPGGDGDYSNEATVDELRPYVDAITKAGGFAFLDLQPGRAGLLDQAKLYEELLKQPNVGLALDPEWKLGPTEQPMARVGHVEAAEINEVSDWLAALTRENKLPQKGLIVHQFQTQMIRQRETVNTDHPELAFILHADGHGPRGVKLETWRAVQEGLSPDFFMAWKNFIDEDTPMATPAETYAIKPRPWFVSYQ